MCTISFQAFTKVRDYLEEAGKKGDVFWVGTRKKKSNNNRYVFGAFLTMYSLIGME